MGEPLQPLILERFPLGAQWPTADPFLFVAHHRDAYPPGTDTMGPQAKLDGRRIGMDFDNIDGWNMYHGSSVPGFPQHPHRGFETITYVRQGLIDHSDSMGATARFGRGDTQWMTAGAGVVHAEMFPLVNRDRPNPLELFQIWLNLPQANKMVDPYFTMNWSENQARHISKQPHGELEMVTIVGSISATDNTGELISQHAPQPPPDSWAAQTNSQVAITHIRLTGRVSLTVAPADDDVVNRTLYVFDGGSVGVGRGGETIDSGVGVRVKADQPLLIGGVGQNADAEVECLIMQGRPIGEPVAQYGPFVMNDKAEVVTAFEDYQRTQFGGWPWPNPDPVHDHTKPRFARHVDGTVEHP